MFGQIVPQHPVQPHAGMDKSTPGRQWIQGGESATVIEIGLNQGANFGASVAKDNAPKDMEDEPAHVAQQSDIMAWPELLTKGVPAPHNGGAIIVRGLLPQQAEQKLLATAVLFSAHG